jgi:hypothetical protein
MYTFYKIIINYLSDIATPARRTASCAVCSNSSGDVPFSNAILHGLLFTTLPAAASALFKIGDILAVTCTSPQVVKKKGTYFYFHLFCTPNLAW